MYLGVFAKLPALVQPATISWLTNLDVVSGCGLACGVCAATPKTPATPNAAHESTNRVGFTELLPSIPPGGYQTGDASASSCYPDGGTIADGDVYPVWRPDQELHDLNPAGAMMAAGLDLPQGNPGGL